ncbi:MAG: hypothetical protein QXT27_01740 [Pyrobaculum sp.]
MTIRTVVSLIALIVAAVLTVQTILSKYSNTVIEYYGGFDDRWEIMLLQIEEGYTKLPDRVWMLVNGERYNVVPVDYFYNGAKIVYLTYVDKNGTLKTVMARARAVENMLIVERIRLG